MAPSTEATSGTQTAGLGWGHSRKAACHLLRVQRKKKGQESGAGEAAHPNPQPL